MKKTIRISLDIITVMIMIFIMGITIPFVVTTIMVVFTEETYNNIMSNSVAFWLFSIIIGIISATVLSYYHEKN